MKNIRDGKKTPQVRDRPKLKAAPDPFFRLPAAWITVVLALTFLAYYPVLRFQFVYDDIEQIVKNQHIQSWQYLSDYFTQSLWSQGDTFQVRFYRPLFLVWLRLNDSLFALNPFYWHLTTLVSHVCATYLVYLLVRKLSKNWQPAILSALFFGLHPIHIQVAAWISAVSESLLAASLLGSLACYVASTSRKTGWWLASSLVLYTSALLLKETATVFPAIIFLYVWLWHDPEKQPGARTSLALIRALPFLVTTAAYFIIRACVLHTIITNSAPMGVSTLFFSLPSIILTYTRLFLWPTRLSPLYQQELVTSPGSRHFWDPLLVCILLVVSLYFLIRYGNKRMRSFSVGDSETKLALLACLWAMLFMLPPLYLPALQEDALVQDRYLYIPSAGLAIVAGLVIASIGRDSRKFQGIPWIQILTAGAVGLSMVIGIRREVYVWANNVSLFTRAIERSPENNIARHDLAAALLDAARYDEGIMLLRKLLNEDPGNYADNNNLGQAYLNKGDRVDAEGFLAKSCQAHTTAGCLYQLGAVRFNLGKAEAAEQMFREAIAMDPAGVRFHSGLGLALERLGKPELAKEAFRQELTINPGDPMSQQALSRLSASSQTKINH